MNEKLQHLGQYVAQHLRETATQSRIDFGIDADVDAADIVRALSFLRDDPNARSRF